MTAEYCVWIQELEDERALLLAELRTENDPVLVGLRLDLVFSLDSDIYERARTRMVAPK